MGRTDSTYYGRIAYEAQREHRGWTDETGSHIPEWDDIGEDAQQTWVVVGEAVVKAYTGDS